MEEGKASNRTDADVSSAGRGGERQKERKPSHADERVVMYTCYLHQDSIILSNTNTSWPDAPPTNPNPKAGTCHDKEIYKAKMKKILRHRLQ